MVARLVRDQEAVGSNPVSSTKQKATVKYRCFLFAPTELIPPLGQETSAPKGGDPIKRELPLYGEEEPRQREDKTASFPFSA